MPTWTQTSTCQELLHRQIITHQKRVEEWFEAQRPHYQLPVYSSYDIRDSGAKIVPVDANIYPAGFNNICQADREETTSILRSYLDRHYKKKISKILLLTEEHTQNPYYWENVRVLVSLLEKSGNEVRLAIPGQTQAGSAEIPLEVKTLSGETFRVPSLQLPEHQDHQIEINLDGFVPDLIISNNDFSSSFEDWGKSIITPMNPPHELGWHTRKKSRYFNHFNNIATEFAKLIDVDPWMMTVDTELFENFDTSDPQSLDRLAQRVELMLQRLRIQLKERKITQPDFIFIKNNSGTYGLGVLRVGSGEEVKSLNYKARKRMKAAKGGREVEEVILQEGIPSVTMIEQGVTAEPSIYLIGSQLAGGFLRAHHEKDPTESLNSPGAVYQRLCVSDLRVSAQGHPLENVYGWTARLGALAIGREAEEMAVQYKGFSK